MPGKNHRRLAVQSRRLSSLGDHPDVSEQSEERVCLAIIAEPFDGVCCISKPAVQLSTDVPVVHVRNIPTRAASQRDAPCGTKITAEETQRTPECIRASLRGWSSSMGCGSSKPPQPTKKKQNSCEQQPQQQHHPRPHARARVSFQADRPKHKEGAW